MIRREEEHGGSYDDDEWVGLMGEGRRRTVANYVSDINKYIPDSI